MTLEQYRERVAALARRRDGEPLYNGSLDHAAVLVENMFAHAHDRLCILSGELNARVYGPDNVLEQARLFLADPKHSLKILLEDSNEELVRNHPFFEAFGQDSNVEVRRVPSHLRDTYDFHFMVMDGDSYRFEGDKTKHSAIAAFGEAKGAQNLERIFNDLWNASPRVALPVVVAA